MKSSLKGPQIKVALNINNIIKKLSHKILKNQKM
jgi:hypothetical protein